MSVKYSDVLIDHLVELGYTHCFFLGGGNVMHLIESARTRMECVAVVHEVSAGIAAEYFNVANRSKGSKAVVFVTAGPGLTNLITAIGGAWLESRELLIIGGQARTEFLSRGTVRQIGHQEIDGVGITKPITKASLTVEEPLTFEDVKYFSELSGTGRKGPVFIELCLDVSAKFVEPETLRSGRTTPNFDEQGVQSNLKLDELSTLWAESKRPLLLVGQGLSFDKFNAQIETLRQIGLPVATTWNAADYLDYDDPIYAGRPNTYGMRWANAVIQQSDLLVVVGARLGLQQTGFNWEEFAPLAKKVHVEIDQLELEKINPGTDLKIHGDANEVFDKIVEALRLGGASDRSDWLSFLTHVKSSLTTSEEANNVFPETVNPFEFVTDLGLVLQSKDSCLIPCSSGGSYTTIMQAFQQKQGQLLTNDKGLASMGYGLAGAIGTAIAEPTKTVYLVEGDGGFAQNLNEVGTVANRSLNLKMIVFSNGGYASIRISQRAYFNGNYIGCDAESGIGLPNWEDFFAAYGIPTATLTGKLSDNPEASKILNDPGPGAIVVKVHQEQAFFPKLTSRIFPDGTMKSNPLHLLTPPLSNDVADDVLRYLPEEQRYAQ